MDKAIDRPAVCYDAGFYRGQRSGSLASAEKIVPIVRNIIPIDSVIDIGCGVGGWLYVLKRHGVSDLVGYDVSDLPESEYLIDKKHIKTRQNFADTGFKIDEKAELLLCLEVAEHLPEDTSDAFIKTLTGAAPIVLFSAAIPGQTGVHHVNEKPPWYWRRKFRKNGYREIDFLRPLIYQDREICWWYRQNLTCFVRMARLATSDSLKHLIKASGPEEEEHKLTVINEWILRKFMRETPEASEYTQSYFEDRRDEETLCEALVQEGIEVERIQLDVDQFKAWLRKYKKLYHHYAPLGDVAIEKCLEHYLAYVFADIQRGSRYIDIAAAGSPWAEWLRQEGVYAYSLDMAYAPGLNGNRIGANAVRTGLADASVEALSLQCSFETFCGENDMLFLQEAARILVDGGKIVISPLYIDEKHFILTSRNASLVRSPLDPGAIKVWREDSYDEAFSRHYSAEALRRRIVEKSIGLDCKIYYIENMPKLRQEFPGQRIYCRFMLYMEKRGQKNAPPGLFTPNHSTGDGQPASRAVFHPENRPGAPAGDGSTTRPYISIVVPTRNRCRSLEKLLAGLQKQTYPHQSFEVVVVDNGSTDDTQPVCRRCRELFPNFKSIFEPRPGLHVGRHAGFKASEGEIVVFTDDDVEPFPTWLEGLAVSFSSSDVGLASGKSLPKFEIEPPGWVAELRSRADLGWHIGWYSLLDFGDQITRIPHQFVWGCNFAIPRNVFEQTGGFHPDAFPQELIKYRGDGETALAEEVRRLGLAAVYNPKASVYHVVPSERLTLDYLYRRVFNQGISDSYTRVRKTRRPCEPMPPGNGNNSLQDIIASGYAAGFNYHQRMIRADADLMAWVVKDNYFN